MKITDTSFPFNMTQSVFESSSAFRNAMGQAAVNFWNGQDQIINAMEDYVNACFERRQAGVQDALHASQQMIEAESPVEALRECQKWAMGSIERMVDDGISCQKHLLSMSTLLAPPLSPSGERTETQSGSQESRRRSPSRVAA
ncbi:MAG TPA: hypothetical protein VKT73_03905 [Xanthobacteraceae bacterium]|nr:hypothetical protein [Xanthobacteraceae bacterium]